MRRRNLKLDKAEPAVDYVQSKLPEWPPEDATVSFDRARKIRDIQVWYESCSLKAVAPRTAADSMPARRSIQLDGQEY